MFNLFFNVVEQLAPSMKCSRVGYVRIQNGASVRAAVNQSRP